ncbi:DUF1775 domain-containing protein [Micromonospora craniellae]|uniref:DUF1775 domain-containing protein n=1 Tax=Micromonospora craniellae TaxID=2294034 RepID=A0A372G2Z0_9ACTN|nr:DUF1775 domain-containing protein [Micromonospora craniellae]QOC92112.1 DUF1775 domain-containing protein [Micromonospora craniellae]RFS47431.1 DUF1775 domain-containing protein [Micromonospora craniellae]
MTPRRLLRTAAVAAGVIAYLALGAVPAAAHVEVAGARPNGDGTTTLTFAFDHSCDDSPTTELVVALPEGATATGTVEPDGWSAAVAGDRVTFTGPGLETAEVGVTTRIVAQAGDTLHFPVLQRCADGNSLDWIDRTADSDYPAPRLIATNAVLETPPEATVAPPPAAGGVTPPEAGGATLGQALTVLVVFVAAAAVAGFVVARRTT